MSILEREDELKEIVQLVGPDALPERDRAVLLSARILREDFLQQNAFHEIDTFCSYNKQYKMLDLMLKFYDLVLDAVEQGVATKQIEKLSSLNLIARLKIVKEADFDDHVLSVEKKINSEIKELISQAGAY